MADDATTCLLGPINNNNINRLRHRELAFE